jgi:WD40-like Beta Propeller Repeat
MAMNELQKPRSKAFILLLAGVFLLVSWGCLASSNSQTTGRSSKQPTATRTVTASLTLTATPTVTESPTVTATQPTLTLSATLEIIKPSTATPFVAVPTQTPAPTYTPIPPTATPVTQAELSLKSSGPWLLMGGENGLWAANQDGTGLVRLEENPIAAPRDLSKAISPKGGYVAYIIYGDLKQKLDPILKILKLPEGRVAGSYQLTSNQTDPEPGAGVGTTAYEANRAIVADGSLAWSPDGNMLAFIGAQEGTTADLYIYRVDEGKAIRLTSEFSQAYQPVWSPDGAYLAYWGVKSFGIGKGLVMEGAWSVVVDGDVVQELYATNALPNSNDEQMQGWISNREMVIGSWNASCGNYNLRRMNVKTAVETDIYPACYSSAALDQDSAALIYGVSDFDVKYCSCSKLVEERGVYMLPNGRSVPDKLGQENIYNFYWLDKVDLFLASVSNGWETAYSADGQAVNLPENVKNLQPVVSTVNGKWVWTGTNLDGEQGVWIGTLSKNATRIYTGSTHVAAWSPDGLTLFFWTDDGQFFDAKSPDFTPIKIDNILATSAGWVIP